LVGAYHRLARGFLAHRNSTTKLSDFPQGLFLLGAVVTDTFLGEGHRSTG
jgi:hypothetical protein